MRSILLPVRVFAQPEAQCGNTSLRMVCHYHRVPATIRELAKLARTHELGTDHCGLVDAAAKKGATVFSKANGTLAELRFFLERDLPVLIGWWSMEPEDLHFDETWTLPQRRAHDCGHYSVVCGITPRSVVIADPQQGDDGVVGVVHRPTKEFLATWYDTDTDRYERVDRWYMVANFRGERFASTIRGGRDRGPIARARR